MKLGPQVVRRVIDPASLRSTEEILAPTELVGRCVAFFRVINHPLPPRVWNDGVCYALPVVGETRSPARILAAGTVQERAVVELRSADEGREKGFTGRLVPYDVWAPIGSRFLERMSPGVFARSIQAVGSLPLHLNHDHSQLPIGRSVEWDDRADGLHGRWVMADTAEGRNVGRMISEGFLSGLSVGYSPDPDSDVWEMRTPPELTRVTRRQARLLEVSVCSVPTWEEAGITRPAPNLERMRAWRATVAASNRLSLRPKISSSASGGSSRPCWTNPAGWFPSNDQRRA